jgi:hypothetical protein
LAAVASRIASTREGALAGDALASGVSVPWLDGATAIDLIAGQANRFAVATEVVFAGEGLAGSARTPAIAVEGGVFGDGG